MMLRVAGHEVPADHAAQLVVADAQGRRVAVLGLRMTSLLAGVRGGVLSGTDATGSYRCRLRIDRSTGNMRVELAFEVADRLRPAARLEVVRFAAALLPHHTLSVMLAGQPLAEPVPVPALEGANQEAADAMIKLLGQLITIEHLAVTTFEMPVRIPPWDKDAIRTAHILLTGGTAEINATMTATVVADDTAGVRELAATHGLIQGTCIEHDYKVEIFGQRISIGPVTVETPPLEVTGAAPTGTGLELSVRTSPAHADQPARITPYRPTNPA